MVLGAMPSVAAHAEVFPGKDGIENQTAEYHALAPKTVVVLSDRHNPELYPAQRINPPIGRMIWLVGETAAGRLPEELR